MARISQILRARLLGNVRGDLLGGLTAGIVALPLALGFGVASGIDGGAAAGLYGAIAVGLFAALLGGTPSQVSGPTGPMTVVVAGIAATLPDPDLVFLAVLLGGAVQVAFGVLRLGRYIQYVPYPVISGFMSGIGVIIVLLQLPVLLGQPAVSKPLEGLRTLPAAIAAADLAALGLGLGTIAAIYLVPRLTKKVPGTLVALVAFTAVAVLAGLTVPSIGTIPTGLPSVRLPALDLAALEAVLPAAITLAALGSIDSLLTSLVADKVTSTRHDSEQELVGQGLGNVAAALIGGLPGAGATMRTVVNVRSGGRTHLAGIVHSAFLLAVLLGLGPLAAKIPMAVLAGILITVGIGIIDYKGLRHIVAAPRGDSAVMLLVLVITVVHDLMWAVGAGTILASLLLVKRFGDRRAATHAPLRELRERLGWAPPPSASAAALEEVHVLQLDGPLFFGNALGLQDVAAGLEGARRVVMSLEGVLYLDQSGVYALEDLLQALRAKGTTVYLAGVSDDLRRLLERLEVVPGLVPPGAVFTTKEEALLAATGGGPEVPEPAAIAVG